MMKSKANKIFGMVNSIRKSTNYMYFISYVRDNNGLTFGNQIVQSKMKIVDNDDIVFVSDLIQKQVLSEKPVTIIGISLLDTMERDDDSIG